MADGPMTSDVSWRHTTALAAVLLLLLAACGQGAERASSPTSFEPLVSVGPSVAPVASTSPSDPAAAFPTAVFAGLGEEPVSDELAGELQEVLDRSANGDGLTATVITSGGTWSGATGFAAGDRAMRPDDQMSIASITKTLVAAQVMRLVEAGELGLDDSAADHLSPDLDFDSNGATIRQLLGHRSGLPGYDPALFDPAVQESPSSDPQRVWTSEEMLGLVLPDRNPPGQSFEYTNTNYLLLGLVIERVRGRPIAEVLRDGVLSIEGVERLIYQPDEAPTEPMAMPFGGSTDILEEGGGSLPSLAGASVDGAAAAMASDSPALARWWRAFCAGEIVSETSLAEMTTMHDGYGLGLYAPDPPGTVGHGGEHVGYMSLAGCLPEQGVVVVVLGNDMIDTSAVAEELVDAVSD